MERKELKKKIYETVKREGGLMTADRIAKLLGYKKSPHFIGVLKEMCEQENSEYEPALVCQWQKHSNRTDCRFFSTSDQVRKLL